MSDTAPTITPEAMQVYLTEPGLAAAADKLEAIGKFHHWWDENLRDWSWRTTDDSIGREEFLSVTAEIIRAHQEKTL